MKRKAIGKKKKKKRLDIFIRGFSLFSRVDRIQGFLMNPLASTNNNGYKRYT